ncbi:hypothetical protein ACFQ9X_08225 [Catenulispora yoronensis]
MLDVKHIVHVGRSGLVRRRMAAISGGTVALVATGLAVGVLVPAGSAGRGGSAVGAGVPAATPSTTPAGAASPSGDAPLPAQVDPHDPAVTQWQFGYLPDGMGATGGGGGTAGGGTVGAYADSGFRLQLGQLNGEPELHQTTDGSAPTTKIPARVTGAVKALWLGYADDRVLQHTGIVGDFATLAWERPDGQWLRIDVAHAEKRADWQEQTLKAAAKVVRQDRSVPMPIKLSSVPKGFESMGASTTRDSGNATAELNFWTAPDHSSAPIVMIVAFKTGSWKIGDWVPPQNKNTCEDSNGLTVCVSSPVPEPGPLTDAGGAKGLLGRVTSLGNDPSHWTTAVLP